MDDLALQSEVHLQSALQFAHNAAAKNQDVHSYLHAARVEADLASRQAAIYFSKKRGTFSGPLKAKLRKVLPSFWYVPGGLKSYLAEKSIDPWDFDSHVPRFDTLQQSSISYIPLPNRVYCGFNDFI